MSVGQDGELNTDDSPNPMTESIPEFVTHYYRSEPFRSLTELPPESVDGVLAEVEKTRELPRRLRPEFREFYFEQRRQFEVLMHRQFVDKGGRPTRTRPHYAVLGESEIWDRLEPQRLAIPLEAIPSEVISFTYSDSWTAYVDRDLRGNPIPRKPQYGMVYRLEELPALFTEHGWPGDRWKTEPEWEHVFYVEAQIWDDGPWPAEDWSP